MIDSLYYSSWKILEGCENTFVDYQELQNKLQKACYLMRQLKTYFNSPNKAYKNKIPVLSIPTTCIKCVCVWGITQV